ncbi:hypothetical protein BDR26DRAFT_995729 [Obelidium mucronatum]|nr:hypothetical protein BDR26DRAFT_995729 [Obelidium mucronatum]
MSQEKDTLEWDALLNSINNSCPSTQYQFGSTTKESNSPLGLSFSMGAGVETDNALALYTAKVSTHIQPDSLQHQQLHPAPPNTQQLNSQTQRISPYSRPHNPCHTSSPLSSAGALSTKARHQSVFGSSAYIDSRHITQSNYSTGAITGNPDGSDFWDALFENPSHTLLQSQNRTSEAPTSIQNEVSTLLDGAGSSEIEEQMCFEESNSSGTTTTTQDLEKKQKFLKIHRENERQRRESLRVGFEKLKKLLPPSLTIGERSWSQPRLLECGLEYIEELKRKSEDVEMDNCKCREALRRRYKVPTYLISTNLRSKLDSNRSYKLSCRSSQRQLFNSASHSDNLLTSSNYVSPNLQRKDNTYDSQNPTNHSSESQPIRTTIGTPKITTSLCKAKNTAKCAGTNVKFQHFADNGDGDGLGYSLNNQIHAGPISSQEPEKYPSSLSTDPTTATCLITQLLDESDAIEVSNEKEKQWLKIHRHRENERQRRDSLRRGFDKLKKVLPDSMAIGERSWSQPRLLEYGLEYIVELKRLSAEKAEENRKCKDILRQFADLKDTSIPEFKDVE